MLFYLLIFFYRSFEHSDPRAFFLVSDVEEEGDKGKGKENEKEKDEVEKWLKKVDETVWADNEITRGLFLSLCDCLCSVDTWCVLFININVDKLQTIQNC